MNDLFDYLLAIQKGGGGGGGKKEQLQTPTISRGNTYSEIIISDFDANTTAYEIYVDGELAGTITRTIPAEITDLIDTEWEFNDEIELENLGVFEVRADFTSPVSSSHFSISSLSIFSQGMFWGYYFAYGYLNKGDRIYVGFGYPVRVFNTDGNIAECFFLNSVGSGIPFNSTDNEYVGSDLDIYLNQTVYDAAILNHGIPAEAILDKTITQGTWYNDSTGDPVHNGTGLISDTEVPYVLSFSNQNNMPPRRVYAPSVQDILDYVTDLSLTDGTISYYNIWKLIWGDLSPHSSQFWLRDADASDATNAWGISGEYGMLGVSNITETNGEVFAMATLDLSKVLVVIGNDFFANPVKGNIIESDNVLYRVINTNGRIAEVLMLANPLGTQVPFGADNTYAGSALDSLLNETLYGGLSDDIKRAIIDKTFAQDSWYSELSDPSGNPIYQAQYGDNNSPYLLSLGSAEYGSEITRHIYTLSLQDIIDYLGATPEMTQENTTITKNQVNKITNAQPGSNASIWLRSASAGNTTDAFSLVESQGALDGGVATGDSCEVYPMLQVDTSKVVWSIFEI